MQRFGMIAVAALFSISPAIAQTNPASLANPTNAEPAAPPPSQSHSMNPAARPYEASPSGTATTRTDTKAVNRGVGTAANGTPIGSPGSGAGSPEHPIDSGRHEGQYNP